MNKSLIAAVATAASLLAAGAAHAGNVYWSIGISAPPVGTVISNGPVYAPVYAPAPVVYAPPPVVYAPPPVVYQPAPRVVYPAPVVVGRPVPIGYHPGWGDRDRDGIPNRYDRHDNRYGHHQHYYRDRDRDGIPDRHDRRDDRKYRH